jgi:hypothetical protein
METEDLLNSKQDLKCFLNSKQYLKCFSSTVEVSGDKTQYTFTRLPNTGHAYDITIVAVVETPSKNKV